MFFFEKSGGDRSSIFESGAVAGCVVGKVTILMVMVVLSFMQLSHSLLPSKLTKSEKFSQWSFWIASKLLLEHMTESLGMGLHKDIDKYQHSAIFSTLLPPFSLLGPVSCENDWKPIFSRIGLLWEEEINDEYILNNVFWPQPQQCYCSTQWCHILSLYPK